MNAIHLLPLGGASPELSGVLAGPLREAFRARVETRADDMVPERFFDRERGQYNSTALLMELKRRNAVAAPVGTRTLAIVPFDLFIPILTYVFGEAELGGDVAVVSYYRLAPERYGLPVDPALLAARFVKEAIHELGHAGSLVHCSTQSCVMHASSYVEEIDLKESSFCPLCARELAQRTARS